MAKVYVAIGSRPARQMRDRTQKNAVLEALFAAGPQGATREQLAHATGLSKDRVTYYISDLRRNGLVANVGESGAPKVALNAHDAMLAALLSLEEALVAKAKEHGITPDMERAFVRYTKVKERVLRPGTDAEGIVAMRIAAIDLLKVVL